MNLVWICKPEWFLCSIYCTQIQYFSQKPKSQPRKKIIFYDWIKSNVHLFSAHLLTKIMNAKPLTTVLRSPFDAKDKAKPHLCPKSQLMISLLLTRVLLLQVCDWPQSQWVAWLNSLLRACWPALSVSSALWVTSSPSRSSPRGIWTWYQRSGENHFMLLEKYSFSLNYRVCMRAP